MPRKKAEPTFEENLTQLEAIVSELESGEASLNDIMAKYTSGVELSRKCMEALKKAEEQIDLLLVDSADGSISEQPLENYIEGE